MYDMTRIPRYSIRQVLWIITAGFLALACDDTVAGIDRYEASMSIEMPDGLENAKVVTESIRFKNVSNGRTTTYDSRQGIDLIEGLYDVSYDADAERLDGKIVHLKAFRQSIQINASQRTVSLKAFETLTGDDFLISEIFFTGTLRSSGNQYNGDQYIKIYNNTDHVLYADGLTLFESKFVTTQKFDYTPDIMSEAMTVHALYTIPGNGTDHPVAPGEEMLICDTGIDHRVANPNSFDLSNADFEWYDISSKPSHTDIDSPSTPNLDKWYCYTLSFFILHNRGFRAVGIARIPIEKESYLKDYWYTYDYVMNIPAGTFPMSQSAYRLPNKWIVDVVNCSVQSEFTWLVTDSSLDSGWTFCGTTDSDKTRYFHSVRRKMLYLNSDGNPYLKDTNNSAEDFNPYCTPSEIERQGTAIDANGTKASTRTYDGVTPIEHAANEY